jgi:hypothetical protein
VQDDHSRFSFDYYERMSEFHPEELSSEYQLRLGLIKRIFMLQMILVVATALLVPLSIYTGLGWFWFAFAAGIFGSSIALLRRVTRGGSVTFLSENSWVLLMSPLLFGGILAGIAYFFMASGMISGETGSGLLKTNLFPSFGPGEGAPSGLMEKPAHMINFLKIRPSTLQDAAKLVVWCLLAGYSENFITGILSTLERRATPLVEEPNQSE